MKQWISGSLLVCLLVLSSSFLVPAQASAHPASLPGGPSTLTPISLSRLQTLVRQTLGQQAVDHMGQLVTQPLSTRTSAPVNLSFHQAGVATSSQLRANTQERISISNRDAGYWVNAEGASWVQGVVGFFPVAQPAGAPSAPGFDTVIGVSSSDEARQIIVGVDQTNSEAFVGFRGQSSQYVFFVHPNDQMDTEIYLDGATNQWLVFIEDLTTRQAFGQEFSYTVTSDNGGVFASWFTGDENNAGPVPSMNPITFTNARWLSNWAGWQPITSSAETSYTFQILQAPLGGVIVPTTLDSSGASFTLNAMP
jgi:hypothetical protein